jgi:selenocysteine-specific elongation factor
MPREELRNRLKLKAAVFAPVVSALETQLLLSSSASWLKLPSHSPALSPAQQSQADTYLKLLASSPYAPPTDSPPGPELLAWLESEGKVVRIGDVVFLSSAFDEMRQRLTAHMASAPPFTVNEVRDLFGTSRKYVLALLEELDRQGVTARHGDERTLRRSQ